MTMGKTPSLAVKVAIGVSALAVALVLILGGIAFELSRARLMSAHDQQLELRAEIQARHAGQVLLTIERSLMANAANAIFANALADSGGRDGYLRPFLKDFDELGGVAVHVELRDYRGRPIAANSVPALSPSGDERIGEVIRAAAPRAWIDGSGDTAIATLVAPVIYANTGLPEGALVYQFALRGIMDLSQEPGEYSMRLIGPDGRAVLSLGHSDPSDLLRHQAVTTPVLFGGNLSVAIGMPRSLVHGGLARLVGLYALAGALGIAVIIPLSLLLARTQLRRLAMLEAAANEVVATGRLDTRVPVTGADEIARLSASFNHMLSRLQEAVEQLERERAQEAALYAARHRRLLATTREGYVLVGSDGVVLETNEAFCTLVGRPLAEVQGRRVPDFLAPLVTNLGPTREIETIRANGEHVVMLGTTSLDVDEAGDRSVFIFLTDITERRAAEDAVQEKSAELERSNSELQQFAYAASHDLQEPLRMINAYLGLLQEKMAELGHGDAEVDEFIGYATSGARRMSTLIRDLLDYSRAGTRAVEMAPVPLREALDEALLNLKVRIDDEKAELSIPPDLPEIMGDRGQIVRLLQNVIGNALKFRRAEVAPAIAVTARPTGGRWEITIADNGIGIDNKQLSRIFEPFQRLHSRNQYEGTGLGLALVKRIVERHGGQVRVTSEPGIGTELTFSLPAITTEAP